MSIHYSDFFSRQGSRFSHTAKTAPSVQPQGPFQLPTCLHCFTDPIRFVTKIFVFYVFSLDRDLLLDPLSLIKTLINLKSYQQLTHLIQSIYLSDPLSQSKLENIKLDEAQRRALRTVSRHCSFVYGASKFLFLSFSFFWALLRN